MFTDTHQNLISIDSKLEDAEKQPDVDVKVENIGHVPLKVDVGVITDFLNSWGFSTTSIDHFHIVFKPGKPDYPFPGKTVGGFYRAAEDEDYIEVYTTMQIEQDGKTVDEPVTEEEIRATLLHELWHAVQRRMEKNATGGTPDSDHPTEKDAEGWAQANNEKYQIMLTCTESEEVAEETGEANNEANGKEGEDGSILISESEHPALDWDEKMDEIADQYKKGEITIEEAIRRYIDLFDRGRNMAKAKEGKIDENEVASKALEVKNMILAAAEEKGKKAA